MFARIEIGNFAEAGECWNTITFGQVTIESRITWANYFFASVEHAEKAKYISEICVNRGRRRA